MEQLIDLGVCKVRTAPYPPFIEDYLVYNPDSTPRGIASADVRELEVNKGPFMDHFKTMGFHENDMAALIYLFYPNGQPQYRSQGQQAPELEKMMRRGVGSRVWEFMISDLMERFNIKIAYCAAERTDPHYMIPFLLKRGFSKLEFKEEKRIYSIFYKIL